jgi:hypothetical protein
LEWGKIPLFFMVCSCFGLMRKSEWKTQGKEHG